MGSGYLRRSINYAFSRDEPTPFPRCKLCNDGDGRVTVKDRARDRVNLICRDCAQEFIDDYKGQPCAQIISDIIAGKRTVDPDLELPTHWAVALPTDDE